jgi:energy-coupling factor transporter ATP-binding protein EcfA2
MIEKLYVKKDTEADDIFFFNEIDFTKLPNYKVVPLFGINGIGKTTLLKEIHHVLHYYNKLIKEQELVVDDLNDKLTAAFYHDGDLTKYYQNKIDKCDLKLEYNNTNIVYKYFNSEDNFRVKRMGIAVDPVLFNCKYDAQSVSEGQSIIYSIFDLLTVIRKDIPKKEGINYVFLFDELDSGLSIDNIDIIMRKIKYIVDRRDDVQFFISFNNPRVLKTFPNVISLYDGNCIKLNNEDDMMDVINENKEMFNKARKTSKGMPKVFG